MVHPVLYATQIKIKAGIQTAVRVADGLLSFIRPQFIRVDSGH